MVSATCKACGAEFDVDFAPGTEFTCGSCGELVTTPATPRVMPVKPPPQGAAPPRAPAGRRAVGPGPRSRPAAAGPPRGAPAPRGGSSGNRKGLIAGAAIVGVIAVIVIIVASTSGDGNGAARNGTPADGDGGRTSGSNTPPAVKLSPYEAAKLKASGGALEDVVAFAELAWNESESAERTGEKDDAARHGRNARWAYGKILQLDPNHTTARRRLGFVRFSISDARKYLDAEYLTPSVRDALEFAVDDIESQQSGKIPDPLWLKTDTELGREWAVTLGNVQRLEEVDKERSSDPFYAKMRRDGEALRKELSDPNRYGIDFRRKGITGEVFNLYDQYRPYVLLVQRDKSGREDQVAEAWGQTLRDLARTFDEKFGAPLNVGQMDRVTPIVVLRDDKEYAKYMRRRDPFAPVVSGGHFEPYSNRLVCYLRNPTEDRTLLFHEGTHQIVNFAQRNAPSTAHAQQGFWFSEGMAEYFAGHGQTWKAELGRYRYVPGKIYEDKIDLLASAKERGDLFPIADLLDYRIKDEVKEREDSSKSRKRSIAYAQGWGMVYFLNQWQNGKYADQFMDYLKSEFSGNSGMSAFRSAFGTDVAGLEAEFHQMIDVLKKAKDEKRIVNGELVGEPKKD